MEKTGFLQVLISSPSKQESQLFSAVLLQDKLVAGCLITEGAAQYWWDDTVVEKPYWNIQAFTVEENKQAIISKIETIASDKCPIIAFFVLDGNTKFLQWIKESSDCKPFDEKPDAATT